MPLRTAVEHEPPVPQETLDLWREELARIAPRNDTLSHLHIEWLPGDWWETNVLPNGTRAPGICRWVVWQMVPRSRLNGPLYEDVLADLQGPDPRSFGRWDATVPCAECEGWKAECIVCGGRGRGAWVSERQSLVSRQQWDLFRRTGCYAKPLWIVQGSKGGHLRRFTEVQSALSRMNGGPAEPPPPGELPYAEPDRRTWHALAALDNVRKFDLMLDYADRKPEMVEAHEQATYAAMREQMWDFLSGQLEDRLKDEKPFIRDLKESLPVGAHTGPRMDEEAIRQRFLSR
jgi:hypothetical protein